MNSKSLKAPFPALAGLAKINRMRRSILLWTVCCGLALGGETRVYFGTYTGPKSKGVYVSSYDPKTGKPGPITLAGEVERPSWVLLHPTKPVLYAVSELGNDGKTQGTISSFTVDASSGKLTFLNKVSSGGGGACHLAIDKTGRFIAVANYGTGSVAVFQLEAGGEVGARTGFMQHSGSSTDPRRQKGPHAHAVVFSPDNRFLFVPDLGLDQVKIYRFDASNGSIVPAEMPFVAVAPGSGPRHFTFHPSGKFAYVINEMGSRVTAFRYAPATGALTVMQTVSTLPADFKGEDNSAEIEVDKKGRFLYASNRGDDSIAVFAIAKSGELTKVQNVSTQGKIPRNIRIDPAGKFLLAANQNSDSVVVFKIEGGKLTPTGQVLEVPSAVCLQFARAGR